MARWGVANWIGCCAHLCNVFRSGGIVERRKKTIVHRVNILYIKKTINDKLLTVL